MKLIQRVKTFIDRLKILWRLSETIEKDLELAVRRFDDRGKDLDRAVRRVADLEKVVGDRTTIGVDFGFKDPNMVVLVGRYRNQDYVEVYPLEAPDFAAFMDHLNAIKRYGRIRRLDGPPAFRAVMERGLDL